MSNSQWDLLLECPVITDSVYKVVKLLNTLIVCIFFVREEDWLKAVSLPEHLWELAAKLLW